MRAKGKTEKKDAFKRGMTQGREAMQRLREVVLNQICNETDTRYAEDDFELIRNMSPLFQMSLIPRVGFLSQVLDSFKRAALFVFIEEKANYAHTTESECDKEPLFQHRQWCYLSVKSMMQTGLFSGRSDAQSNIKRLIDIGLLYPKSRKREHDESNQVTWYSVEYFHPALVFTRKELLTHDVATLKEVANKLLHDETVRGERAKKVLERLIAEGTIRKRKKPKQ